MGVTAREFDALVEDLVTTLDEFDVPRRSRKSCSACSGRRDEIVELESPETGTPLPEIYQPAPALG
jgi:hemoglobin